MVGLRKVYAGLRKKVGMFTQVYAEFTQSLRRVYVEGISATDVHKPA
jgi:hypothetical protein